MSEIHLAGEKQNKRKGTVISIIVHLLLLLLMWFFFFPAPPEKDPDIPPKIVVDFSFKPSSLSKYAHAETGTKKPKTNNEARKKVETPKEVKKVEIKTPTVKKPEIKKPTVKPNFDPVKTPNTQEEAPIEMVEDDDIAEDPEMELEDVPEPEELEEVVEVPVKDIPVDNTDSDSGDTGDPSDTNGTSDTDPSMTEGVEGGTGKGKEGDGPGDGKGDDSTSGKGDVGDGTGEYDGSGDGVFGRKVIYRNLKGVYKVAKQSGIITAKVCINRAGFVNYAEIIDMETDIKDRRILKEALQAFQGYKYEPDFTASKEQCGKLTLKLDINMLRALQGS